MDVGRLGFGWGATLLVFVICAGGQHVSSGRQTYDEIPFKLVAGFAVLVRGDLGPAHDANLLLDTGAIPSVLNERLVRQFGITDAIGQLFPPPGRAAAPYVIVHDVRLGSVYKSDLPMVVVNLKHLEQQLHTPIAALVGLDLFRGQSFSVDYSRKRLIRGVSERGQHSLRAKIIVDPQVNAPCWAIPITVQDKQLWTLVDTGTDAVSIFEDRISVVPDLTSRPTALTLMGEQPLETSGAPVTLALGDRLFRQPVLLRQKPRAGLYGLDGLLGPTSLGLEVIAFDWEHESFLWGTAAKNVPSHRAGSGPRAW